MENNNEATASTSVGNNNIDKGKHGSKKYVFYKKPPSTKNVPQVKQTRTSMQRMMQANPLLKYGMEFPLTNKPSLNNVPEKAKSNFQRSNSLRNPVQKPRHQQTTLLAGNMPSTKTKIGKSNVRLPGECFTKSKTLMSSTRRESNVPGENDVDFLFRPGAAKAIVNGNVNSNCSVKKPVTSTISKKNGTSTKQVPTENKKLLCRPHTPKHFERTKSIPTVIVEEVEEMDCKLMPAKSLENLSRAVQHHDMSTTVDCSRETSLTFKTPSAYKRRSVARFTPMSASINRRTLYRCSTPLPSLHDLQKRLNEWLIKRGKKISLYANLKFFETPQLFNESNKENIETNCIPKTESYEDLRISQNDVGTSNDDKISNGDIETVAREALMDLLNLIEEGYPVSQCEGWLELIRNKYGKLQDEPEYWECRAAIEQSRGNIGKAVECYKTAIVHGAQVTEVDKSLDTLLHKFSLLNISTSNVENDIVTKERARVIQDARNAFKSSIIKFAVQEKKLKNNEIQLVATPVRRSTRLSRSGYTATPGVQIFSSLRELNGPERAKVNFTKNGALN